VSHKALIIEDNRELADLLMSTLSTLGCELECAYDGSAGLELALTQPWCFVLLDMALPGIEGTEICKRLRAQRPQLPIVMLTAASDELNKVLSLELGADDYITKPFSFAELKARIRAVLRRAERSASQAAETLVCGDLVLNLRTLVATRTNIDLKLTTSEFDLLSVLASDQGRVFTRDELMTALHGGSFNQQDAAITTHVNRIRAKLESDPANPKYLQTIHGRGYRLVSPDEE
jgi:two-component system alkaline phosphatase synthesis response regulator PhoP